MGWIIGFVAMIIFVFAYSLCKVAGDSNRTAERDYEEIKKDKCTILSDLEKESIDKLSKDIVSVGIRE